MGCRRQLFFKSPVPRWNYGDGFDIFQVIKGTDRQNKHGLLVLSKWPPFIEGSNIEVPSHLGSMCFETWCTHFGDYLCWCHMCYKLIAAIEHTL